MGASRNHSREDKVRGKRRCRPLAAAHFVLASAMPSPTPEWKLLHVPGCATAYRVPVLSDSQPSRLRAAPRRRAEVSSTDGGGAVALRRTSATHVREASAFAKVAADDDEPPCG
eukprot:scaffold23449_cov131-Isochrysis_galbana.AAC.5